MALNSAYPCAGWCLNPGTAQTEAFGPQTGKYAGTQYPSWINASEALWAPETHYLSGIGYVMFIAGPDEQLNNIPQNGGQYCLGYVVSQTPQGPYGNGAGLFCDTQTNGSYYGVIDPSLYQNSGGNYLLWKRGNVSGGPGATIYIQAINSGLTMTGSSGAIVQQQGTQTVENPQLVSNGGTLWLYTSVGTSFNTTDYSENQSNCGTSASPQKLVSGKQTCTYPASILTSYEVNSTHGIYATGGGDVFVDPDGVSWLAYAAFDQNGCTTGNPTNPTQVATCNGAPRQLFITQLAGLTITQTGAQAVGLSTTPDGAGYYMASADGNVFCFGDAAYKGSAAPTHPVVGISTALDGVGYWLVANDGGIFAFGDAGFYGSMGGQPLNRPMVGMAPTQDGAGYWTVAADGGIFAFGDAAFYGSMAGQYLAYPIVGMAATPDGGGYWLVAQDGGIFAFGDAVFYGSTGGGSIHDIVGMSRSNDGHGYWLVGSDGGIFAYGDSPFHGSMGGSGLMWPVSGMVSHDVGGYWEVGVDGGIYAFGSSGYFGSEHGQAM